MLLFLPNFKIDAWRKNPVESARFFPEILCSKTVYQGVSPRSDHHLRTDAGASPPPRKPGRGQRPTGAGGVNFRARKKNQSGRATAQTAEQRSNHTPPPPARTAHPGEGTAAARQGARGTAERRAKRRPGARTHSATDAAQGAEHSEASTVSPSHLSRVPSPVARQKLRLTHAHILTHIHAKIDYASSVHLLRYLMSVLSLPSLTHRPMLIVNF